MELKRAQQTVLGAILVTGIVIVLVFLAFVWGRPLIQKNLDMTKILTMIDTTEEIDTTIRFVAETGTSKTVDVNLDKVALRIIPDEVMKGRNDLQFEVGTFMPIVSYVMWVPLNTNDLPYINEKFAGNLQESSAQVACVEGETGVKSLGMTIYEKRYELHVFDTPNYNCPNDKYVCFQGPIETAPSLSCEDSCACEGDYVFKDGHYFKIEYVGDNYIEIGGDIQENVGVIGVDKSGIIIGKAVKSGDQNLNMIRLVYRGLEDQLTKEVYRVNLQCSGTCAVGSGEYTLRFILISRERKPQLVESYVGVQMLEKS